MKRAPVASLLVVLMLGCGTASPPPSPPTHAAPTPPPQSEPVTAETVEGCFVEEGAPDPFACEADGDCLSGGLFDPESCCMSGETHAHSRAYHAWQTEMFGARCDGSCRRPPSPPTACEVAVRCDEGRCRNGCGPVAHSDAELDAMERGELELLCEGGSTDACDRLGH